MKKVLIYMVCVLSIGLGFSLAYAEIEMSEDPIYHLSGEHDPAGAGWGDFNEDGWPDLVVTASSIDIYENFADDVSILLLMYNNYGANYNIQDESDNIREQFESYGWTITTAALSSEITPCAYGYSIGNTPINVDTLVSEISDISDYDCLCIMPGSNHNEILADQGALDLIQMALDQNLVVAAWCRTVRILASIDAINGLEVVGHADYAAEYTAAGATYLGDNHPPVIQGNIVTSVRSRFYRTEMCQAIKQVIEQYSLLNIPELRDYQFDDATYGNGDGILDNGETVTLGVTIENTGSGEITDVAVSLFVDDATVVIDDGTSYLGTIAAGATVDINADPLQITIPSNYISRLDTFYIEITYNDSEADTAYFTHSVGTPKILLVDDDSGEGIVNYYTDIFDELKVPVHVWNYPLGNDPDISTLNQYDIVVWFVGGYRTDPMDSVEISVLKQYLDNGGKLFLTGQGIAEQLSTYDADFLNNYLKSDYLSSSYEMYLNAYPEAEIFYAEDTIKISGNDAANNQTHVCCIDAINGGIAEMMFMGNDLCGAVSYSDLYQLVYFAFGFEAISIDEGRFTKSVETMLKILEFFNYQHPMLAPEASDIIITPGDNTHMTDHTPDITWTYSDPGLETQVYYHIQVGVDDDWEFSEKWDTAPLLGMESSVTYSGYDLNDGEEYYFRVRVHNGMLWSDWIMNFINMNSIPVPDSLSPENMEEIDLNPPILSHVSMTDAESDPITYSYQLFNDSLLTSLVEELLDVSYVAGDTLQWQTTSLLTDYEDYYWRARCSDHLEDGEWSDAASFLKVPAYICGDSNGDGDANVGDAVHIINYVFKGGPAPYPIEAGDANCDSDCNVGDAVYLINYVFKGGPAPCEGCE